MKLNAKDQLVKNAKGWVRNNYKNLSFEDMDQEIDIKVWLLEEAGELNYETNEWVRPAFVMTCLKNAVIDWVRKEIGYRKTNLVTDEVFSVGSYSSPGEELNLTPKTAKALVLLSLSNPKALSFTMQEQALELVNLMTEAEVVAINKYLETKDDNSRRATERAIKRVMKVAQATTPAVVKSLSYVASQGSEDAVLYA